VSSGNNKFPISGPGLRGGSFRYGPLTFSVGVTDEAARPIPTPSDAFEFKFSGDGNVAHTVKPDADKPGQFHVEYTPAKSGNYNIDVLFYEKSVLPKPYAVKCSG